MVSILNTKYIIIVSILNIKYIIMVSILNTNTEIFQNSFIFPGTSIWNSIPEYIKTAPSVKQFKSLYLRWFKQSSEN